MEYHSVPLVADGYNLEIPNLSVWTLPETGGITVKVTIMMVEVTNTNRMVINIKWLIEQSDNLAISFKFLIFPT